MATIGIDYKIKNIEMEDGKNIKLQIWDTAGADRFRSITKNYFKGASGMVLIYDITNKESFYNIKNWINQIREEASDKIPIILVGNKIDNEKKRIITYEEGIILAEEYGIMFSECSAKTGENIDYIFKELVEMIYAPDLKRKKIEKKRKIFKKFSMGNVSILMKYISY